MSKDRTALPATIAISATDSDNIQVPSNATLIGFKTPAVLTGTAFSFKGGYESTDTPIAIKALGGASNYSVTVAANGFYPVDPTVFDAVKHITVVSGTAEAASREITLIFGKLQ